MEPQAEKTGLAEQRAAKKAARRAAFIQEVAEAVATKLRLTPQQKVTVLLRTEQVISAARQQADATVARLSWS